MSLERVLVVHNRYELRGGEDVVVESELSLLGSRGHEVDFLEFDNRDARLRSLRGRARATLSYAWSQSAARKVSAASRRLGADIVHFHNTFPLVSASGYWAAHSSGAAVVQTLHNFRMVCPNGLLLRQGKYCTDCVGRSVALPGVVHGCYQGSRLATAAVATIHAADRKLGLWSRGVDVYVALSDPAARVFEAGGLPADRIYVNPNFLRDDPGAGGGLGGYFLLAGRLSHEKGVQDVLDAWERVPSQAHLVVAGDGPLRAQVAAFANRANVTYVGWQERSTVLALMRDASAVLFPMPVYHLPALTVIEAFGVGTPVIASVSAVGADVVADGINGYMYAGRDQLARLISACVLDPERLTRLRSQAREHYERSFTAERHYLRMREIYDAALRRRTDA